jgi:hypothetical protein
MNDASEDDFVDTVITRSNGDLHVTDGLGRMATLHWSRFHGLIISTDGAVYLGQPEVSAWLVSHLRSAGEGI